MQGKVDDLEVTANDYDMTLADHNDRLAALDGQVMLRDYFYVNPSEITLTAVNDTTDTCIY